MDQAKRRAAERRTRMDHSQRSYAAWLDHTAVPLMRQIASVLKAESYLFTVFTPSASVRLMSDKSADDFIEITLDTSGPSARIVGRTSHSRGRRGVETERTIGSGDPESVSDEDLLAFLLEEIEPFVER